MFRYVYQIFVLSPHCSCVTMVHRYITVPRVHGVYLFVRTLNSRVPRERGARAGPPTRGRRVKYNFSGRFSIGVSGVLAFTLRWHLSMLPVPLNKWARFKSTPMNHRRPLNDSNTSVSFIIFVLVTGHVASFRSPAFFENCYRWPMNRRYSEARFFIRRVGMIECLIRMSYTSDTCMYDIRGLRRCLVDESLLRIQRKKMFG